MKEGSLGKVIGVLLIALLVAELVVAFNTMPVKEGLGSLEIGVYLVTWGVLFLLSYFFQERCFFLRGLMWMCLNVSQPKGKAMALLYSALGLGGGLLFILMDLG